MKERKGKVTAHNVRNYWQQNETETFTVFKYIFIICLAASCRGVGTR